MIEKNSLPAHAATYLTHMEQALGTLPAQERTAILEETRAHFLDILSADGERAVQKSMDAFGPPEVYAANFIETTQIRKAIASLSAKAMFKHILRLAGRGLVYFIAAKVIITLYVFSFAFAAIAIIKPILPQSVGLWLSAEADGLPLVGILPGNSVPDTPDLLGYWIIPIAVIACLITFILGNWAARKTLLYYLRKKQ